ncbi:conserved hypothetical protein [Candidatus Terasakiella magnetica]|nr:conserved hypothetical protein [Candidatus Terasakiella magnetica]
MNHIHLWLALSPHGFGHAAMTSPVVNELRKRWPGLQLSIQTAVPHGFLASRYGDDFTHIPEIPDFGLKMLSSIAVDLDASALGYRELHAHWEELVEREAERLRNAKADLVLANVPYVTLAAAALAGIPAIALSSLEWADIYLHYLGNRPEAPRIAAEMRAAYNSALGFIRVTPAMEMPSLEKVVEVGTIAHTGRRIPDVLRMRLGLGPAQKTGLIAFGGIDPPLDLGLWPRLQGWTWLTPMVFPADRKDMRLWSEAVLSFSDVLASVDVVITKPGYGTFTEAALNSVPVLYLPRSDWPESPHLDRWLECHTKALAIDQTKDMGDGLEAQLQKLFSLPNQAIATASGNAEAADAIERLYAESRHNF